MTPELPALPPTPAEACDLAPAIDARLRHLFRSFLTQGRMHPLYLPMRHHRATEKPE